MAVIGNQGGGGGSAPPDSVQILSGPYTVPPGYYAKVKCLKADNQDMTVDLDGAGAATAEIVEAQKTWKISRNSTASQSSFTFTLPTGYIWEVNGQSIVDQVWQNATYDLVYRLFSPNVNHYPSLSLNGYQGFVPVPYNQGTPMLVTNQFVQGGVPIYLAFETNTNSWQYARVYSYSFQAKQLVTKDFYEGIVPAGADIDGELYQVELYTL